MGRPSTLTVRVRNMLIHNPHGAFILSRDRERWRASFGVGPNMVATYVADTFDEAVLGLTIAVGKLGRARKI